MVVKLVQCLSILGGALFDASAKSGFPQDGTIQKYIDDLDTFASTLIQQTNNLYAQSAQPSMQTPILNNLQDDTTLKNAYSSIQEGVVSMLLYTTNKVKKLLENQSM